MRSTLINIFIFLCAFILSSNGKEESVIPGQELKKETYKNTLEFNPTQEGFFIGYERLMRLGEKHIFLFDFKNTAENGDDFGRTGFTYRCGFQNKHLFSSRIETAWIDGQNNLGFRLGYDNSYVGMAVTGIKSLTDPEVVRTEETILEENSAYTDTFLRKRGHYDVFDRTTTTTRKVIIRETRFATPDGLMLDLNFNLFKRCNFSLGRSFFKADDWQEDGFHTQFAWKLTSTDMVGGHYAKVADQEEGGIFYRKRFNSLKDLFKPGPPFQPSEDTDLLSKFEGVPFSTPPIRVVTAQTYIESRQETRVEVKHEDILVRQPDPVPSSPETLPESPPTPAIPSNSPPTISAFNVSIVSAGQIRVDTLTASDPDGSIASWTLTSSVNGSLGGGAWPMVVPSGVYNVIGGIPHTFTITLTDDKGDSSTAVSGPITP